MDNKLINRLLIISSVALAVAGLIFIALYFFGDSKSEGLLGASLSCIGLSNLFNIIRAGFNKNDKGE